MSPFIVLFGRDGREIVYAPSLEAATEKARAFAQAGGMSAEEAHDADEVSARPYDFLVARDLGLAWLDEDERRWVIAEPHR